MHYRIRQQHGKNWIVTDKFARLPHGVTQPAHAWLIRVVNAPEPRQRLHLRQFPHLAPLLKVALEVRIWGKIRRDRFLASTEDDQDVVKPRGDRLLHDIMNDRPVAERQHLLGHCLGQRQKPRAESGGWKDGFHCAFELARRSLRPAGDRRGAVLQPAPKMLECGLKHRTAVPPRSGAASRAIGAGRGSATNSSLAVNRCQKT